MITIISGTNRTNSNTLKMAKIIEAQYKEWGVQTQLCDLNKLPRDLFIPEHYAGAPESFKPFQDMILNTDGILVVLPEYNGGFPGVLKYFIDLLKFPESLFEKPAAFVGVAAGVFGALRPIEQLEMIFQYRMANIYGKRVFFPDINNKLSEDGLRITDDFTREKLEEMLKGFEDFTKRLKP